MPKQRPMPFMNLDDLESILKHGISQESIDPIILLTALHNALAHGESLEKAGYDVDQQALDNLFNGLDKSLEALRSMVS